MTEEEIEGMALWAAIEVYERSKKLAPPRWAMKDAIATYNRERWRLESEEHHKRQAHQREVNVLAATAK